MASSAGIAHSGDVFNYDQIYSVLFGGVMSKETGGQAFPCQDYGYDGRDNLIQYQKDGMTLRDYFAAKAMQMMVSIHRGHNPSSACEQAYVWADAMLEARNKQ